MSEKEATEKQITDKLNEIILSDKDGVHRLLAKLVFNLRFDLNELKLELIKTLKTEEGKPEPEVLKYNKTDMKKVGDNLEDILENDYFK